MSFGLGLGLLVAIGVYLRAPRAPGTTVAAVQPPATRSAPADATAKPQAAPVERPTPADAAMDARGRATQGAVAESRFSFYEVLPQFEVVVPEDEDSAKPATRRERKEAPGSFLLQAGSFSAAADADRLQASLALLGFESHVQRVTIEDDVFNRVRIGPIEDLNAAQRTQRRLRDAGIDTLLMKVPN
jgi:cell division protein FtsN